jgi:hypothetical protein
VSAQGVLGFAYPIFDASQVEKFIPLVSSAFPHVLNRTPGQADPRTPHLVVASSSSQLAASKIQADFQVRFYDALANDVPRGIAYVHDKLDVAVQAFIECEVPLVALGVIVTLHFATNDAPNPVAHLRDVHLQTDVDVQDLQDVVVRFAVRLRNTYFLNFTMSNYESRSLQRPVTAGVPLAVRPWEGELTETGLELTIDMNNVLEAREQGTDPRVTSVALNAVTSTLEYVATEAGIALLDTGTFDINSILAASEPSHL